MGIQSKKTSGPGILGRALRRKRKREPQERADEPLVPRTEPSDNIIANDVSQAGQPPQFATPKRLTVLIATMEYEIEDWGIKVKIGGLGVMSSLMGKNLKHQDLIWVIPW